MKKRTIKEIRKRPEFNRISIDLNAARRHALEALRIAKDVPWNDTTHPQYDPELREFLRADVQQVREVLDKVALALEARGGVE